LIRFSRKLVSDQGSAVLGIASVRTMDATEYGCTKFSNIQGFGPAPLSEGKFTAIFGDVRRGLEREGLIET
jgi:hypothetical protein